LMRCCQMRERETDVSVDMASAAGNLTQPQARLNQGK
jgi:hypothetical protein